MFLDFATCRATHSVTIMLFFDHFCRKRSVPVPHSYNMTILDPFSGHNVAGRVGLEGIRKFQNAFRKGLEIVSTGSEHEKLFQTF